MMYFVLQILAVEILQHKFNIEKMVKILELLQTYTEEGETLRLQVRYCPFTFEIFQHKVLLKDQQNTSLC